MMLLLAVYVCYAVMIDECVAAGVCMLCVYDGL